MHGQGRNYKGEITGKLCLYWINPTAPLCMCCLQPQEQKLPVLLAPKIPQSDEGGGVINGKYRENPPQITCCLS